MDNETANTLMVLALCLGENATEEQAQYLVSYIIENVPQAYWMDAACMTIGVPGVYTDISMRCAENQMWHY